MSKIKEIIVEPAKLYVGSTFRLKVKAIKYLIYEEISQLEVEKLAMYSVDELKGEA